MKKDGALLAAARNTERAATEIRNIMKTYYDQNETTSVQVLRFAGSLCSMASSILCELYETQDSDFTVANANSVLREWGLDELE